MESLTERCHTGKYYKMQHTQDEGFDWDEAKRLSNLVKHKIDFWTLGFSSMADPLSKSGVRIWKKSDGLPPDSYLNG